MSLPKSKLNEYCQKHNLPPPIYDIYPFKGYSHDPIFHGGQITVWPKNGEDAKILKVVNQHFSNKRDIENFIADKALYHLALDEFAHDIEIDGMSGYIFRGGMGQLEDRPKSSPVPIPTSTKIMNPISPIRIPTPTTIHTPIHTIPSSIYISKQTIPQPFHNEVIPKSNDLFKCWDSPSNAQLCVFDGEKDKSEVSSKLSVLKVNRNSPASLKSNVYLIDYDNMAHAGKIIDTLDGKVHLFVSFTFNTDKIPISLNSRIKIHKAHSPNREMVDHMMTWYACKNIKLLKHAKVYIISKDTGMYSLVEILKHKKIDVEFISNVNDLIPSPTQPLLSLI